jgi:hypothetical protein
MVRVVGLPNSPKKLLANIATSMFNSWMEPHNTMSIYSFLFRVHSLILVLSLNAIIAPAVAAQESTEVDTENTARLEPVDQIWFGPAKANLVESWETWNSHSIRCRIIKLDSETLDIRDDQGTLKKLELNRVIAVRPKWNNPQAEEMNRLFYEGNYAEHAKMAATVLKTEMPPYQQRLLLAQVVITANAIGNRVPAGNVFLTLCKNSPPPFLYSVAPLNWVDSQTTKAMETSAETWLAENDEAAQLLGASWLLSGAKRKEAAESLEKLTRSSNSMIADLATCQLWRIVPISPNSSTTILEWQNRRDLLLLPLQLGPTELIADRWRAAQQPSLAAFENLRIAILHRDRYDRVRVARVAAEEVLGKEAVQASGERWQSIFPSP